MRQLGQMAFVFVALVTAVACSESPTPSTCENPVLLSAAAPVTASAQANEARAITDGDANTIWNAGGYPPQWIELDLGSAATVHHVRVVPEQSPAGPTEHKFTATTSSGEPRELGELKGNTEASGQYTLSVSNEAGQGIRKVRVDTVATPSSWVAWHEIEVYGCR